MATGNVVTPYLARLEQLPADYIDEAVGIFIRAAERNGGRMMGRYQLTASEGRRTVSPEGGSVTMNGTPAGFWTWRETGVKPHTIGPRRKRAMAGGLGHPIRGDVLHPGYPGQHRWTRTVQQATAEIGQLGEQLAAKAAG